MSDSKQRKIGVVLSYVSILINTLIQLLYTPFLIKNLGQSEYGLYSLISSIIGYLTVLDLGFGNAIIVYTAKYREQKKYEEEKKLHGMFLIIFIIIGVIATILGLTLYMLVPTIFGDTMTISELGKAKIMMLILTFNLAFTFPFSIYSSIINAYEKFTFQKISSMLSSILKPILMIPLLLLGFKSITMAITVTLVNIFIMLLNYSYCKTKLNIKIKFMGFDKKLFKEILGYSFFIFLSVAVDKINWSLDQFILGAVAGTIQVSIYATATQLNSLFINLSSAVSGVLLPKMSKMIANNSTKEELTNEFIKVGRIQYLVVFLMVSGLILFGKEFIYAWVGYEFKNAYYIALLLIIPLSIPLIQNLGISIMQAKNMHKFRSILYALIAIANLIISIPLARRFGGIGSAIGTSISLIIGNIIIMNIYYHKKVGLDVIKFFKEIIKMTIPNVIPVIIILIIMKFINFHGYYHLIIFGGIYTILYMITSYFITMNNYEKNIVNKLLKKLHLKKV